ncbi:hypothetical protein AAW14_16880 [Streptomyces hygroscopicus]|uniref:hypothetical protein n=1 Tax=Streptomyces hygroscopicus TaxID=1912 RepID=UPI00223F2FFC|nr:hypothetical protein [Streptomyces hygroscopicus]MCW7943678.1 hypothetical protein [Streptomyces hygroscopicus]
MIEAIVSAALAKIAEGSGAALVDLIRRKISRRQQPSQDLELLSRVEAGTHSEDDARELRTLLAGYADQDPDFRSRLQSLSTSVGAINSVTSSNVQKLIQAQNVGDVTM